MTLSPAARLPPTINSKLQQRLAHCSDSQPCLNQVACLGRRSLRRAAASLAQLPHNLRLGDYSALRSQQLEEACLDLQHLQNLPVDSLVLRQRLPSQRKQADYSVTHSRRSSQRILGCSAQQWANSSNHSSRRVEDFSGTRMRRTRPSRHYCKPSMLDTRLNIVDLICIVALRHSNHSRSNSQVDYSAEEHSRSPVPSARPWAA